VPDPPKLSLNLTGTPVAASYSSEKRAVMVSYALRVTAKDTSVRCTGLALLFAFLSSSEVTPNCMTEILQMCLSSSEVTPTYMAQRFNNAAHAVLCMHLCHIIQ